MRLGIVELYDGKSGERGFYNSQEIGMARAMVDLGHSCVIFLMDRKLLQPEEELVEDGILIVYVPSKSIGVHGRFDWRLLLRYGIEVVQINSDNQIFAPYLSRFCAKNDVKQYHYIGTVGSDSKSKLKNGLMHVANCNNRRMLREHKCFAKTRRICDILNQSIGVKSELAPVGLDISCIPQIDESREELRRELSIPIDKEVILFVGRIDPYKSPQSAIELINQLPSEYYLIMIGTGECDEVIDKMIREYSVSNRVRRISKVVNREIHKYYRAADYFVNFNKNEIFGMSILEAMWNGCVVLAIHAPGPDDMICNDSIGILVNNETEMREMLLRKPVRDKKYLQAHVCQNYSWKRTAEIIDRWIRQ